MVEWNNGMEYWNGQECDVELQRQSTAEVRKDRKMGD